MRTLADVPLAPLTTLRLGGPATRLVEAEDETEIVDAVAAADAAAEPVLLLAGGSNVVIADEGFAGTVVHVASSGVAPRAAEDRVELTVAAGEPWDGVVARSVDEGLAGLECLSGIPGSTGATPIQNVGAYGQEVSATVVGVRVHDRAEGTVATLSPDDCAFTYRGSAFKHRDRHVVLSVTFSLPRSQVSAPIRYADLARTLGAAAGDRVPLAEVREAVLDLRRGKGMVIDPGDPDSVSAGSFFTNPILDAGTFAELQLRAAEALGAGGPTPPGFPEPDGRMKTSAAWLIEQAGFARGHGAGAIRLSDKHTLAITNRGGGTTAELIALARELRDGVRATFGVTLVPEPVLVGVEL